MRVLCACLAVLTMIAGAPARAADSEPWRDGPGRNLINDISFALNTLLTRTVIEPTASFLGRWTPDAIKTAAASSYDTLLEPERMISHLIDLNPGLASVAASRFVINGTIGIAGILDPATELGLERTNREFGPAICATGLPDGGYLVLPLVGPTTAAGAGLATGFIVGGYYLLYQISPMLAVADLLVDLSVTAGSLRDVASLPGEPGVAAFKRQRSTYFAEREKECKVPA